MKLTTKLFLPVVIVCVLVVAVAGTMLRTAQVGMMETEMHRQAESVANLFIDIRHVMAVNQDRINTDSLGNFEFKALNPARVGNMVASLVNTRAEIKVKQTSLQVRNAEMDTPDEFEKRHLNDYQTTKSEEVVAERSLIGGREYYRYMKPLKVKQACLKCHGDPAGEIDISGYPKEGYKLGEIRGAISVALPIEENLAAINKNNMFLAGTGVIICVLVIGCIIFFGQKHVVKPILNLVDNADKISMGDFSTTIEPEANDEIGKLAKSFERMRTSLKKSMELLKGDD